MYTAVGDLVGEGADKISFPAIAARAGVSPTTLYRRWDDVDADYGVRVNPPKSTSYVPAPEDRVVVLALD